MQVTLQLQFLEKILLERDAALIFLNIRHVQAYNVILYRSTRSKHTCYTVV